MKYVWRGLAIFSAVFFTYVLLFTYINMEPYLSLGESLTKIVSALYLLFWIPISTALIYYSFKN